MDTDVVINRLFMWGCDTDSALERVLGDEGLYLKFILKYCGNEDIDKLDALILNKNVEEGFTLAHTMKGVYGNLGLTPIYDIVCDIVEKLRNGMEDGVEDKMLELHDAKAELDEIMSEAHI